MLLIKAYKSSSRVKSHYNVGYVKKPLFYNRRLLNFKLL